MAKRADPQRLAIVLALALLAPMLAVWGGGAPAQAQEQPTVTMWFDTTGGAETADCVVQNVIEPYNEQGGAHVDATLQANNWNATRTALAGGAGPDVVVTPGPSFAFDLAQAGQLLALDDFATHMGWSESFVPWALNLGVVDGKLYSIPNEVETLVLYYNKTLFDEKGWTPPTTIEEMMALAEEISAAEIIPFAHANAEWRPANEWFVGEMLNHVGGPQLVYEALTGEAQWTDPAFIEAISLLDEMQQNGWFMGGLDRYYTTLSADAAGALADGEAAMKIEGTWFVQDALTYFEESGQEWDWVPVPSTSGEAIYDLGIGSTYSINAGTEYPEAVAEFLTYYFSPETQATMTTMCQLVPAPVEIPPESLSDLDSRYAAILSDMNEASAANNYGYTTWTFWPPKSDVYIYEEIEKVWAGDMTAEEYLQGLQELFDQEVAEGDIPPIPER